MLLINIHDNILHTHTHTYLIGYTWLTERADALEGGRQLHSSVLLEPIPRVRGRQEDIPAHRTGVRTSHRRQRVRGRRRLLRHQHFDGGGHRCSLDRRFPPRTVGSEPGPRSHRFEL